MSESSKTIVKKLVKRSATLAILGATAMTHVAKAEDIEEVLSIETVDELGATGEDTAVTIPEAEVKVAVAQSETDEAQASLDVAKAKADEAASAIASAEEVATKATESVKKAETALEEAKQIKAEASPEKIAETEENIESKNADLTSAKEAQSSADAEVTEQTKIVTAAEKVVADETAAVETAQTKVDDLQAAIDAPASLAADKEKAEQTEAELKQELESAKSELAKAEASAKSEIATQIANKEQSVKDLEAQVTGLSNETKTVTTAASSDVTGNNTIKVTQAFVDQFKKMNYNYSSASQADKDKLVELGKEVLNLNGVVNYWTNSGYQATAGDDRVVNLNNASEVAKIQTELNLYAAELLNDVRAAFGLNDVVVTSTSLEIGKAVAAAYASKYSYFTDHDFSVVTPAASSYGVSIGAGYENVGQNWVANNSSVSVGELKKHIQSQLVMMIFRDHDPEDPYNQNNFLHAKTFLTSDSTGTTYMGVGLSAMGYDATSAANKTGFVQFYEIYNGGQITDASKVSTTSLGGGTQTVKVDNSAKIAELNNQIATLTSEISTLKSYASNVATYPAVQTAQAKVDELTAKVAAAETTTKNLAAQLEQATQNTDSLKADLVTAQTALSEAKASLTTASNKLATEQATLDGLTAKLTAAIATVNSLEADVASLEALLAAFKNPTLVEDAETALVEAQEARGTAVAALLEAQEAKTQADQNLTEAQAILTEKQAALEEAKGLLAALMAEYEGLVVERDEEGIHAVLDENLTEEELPIAELPVSESVETEGQASGAAGAATTADSLVSKGAGLATGAAVQTLTNKVLIATGASTASAKSAAGSVSSLPKTGDKESLVAAVLGSMMLSSAALAGYKRRQDEK